MGNFFTFSGEINNHIHLLSGWKRISNWLKSIRRVLAILYCFFRNVCTKHKSKKKRLHTPDAKIKFTTTITAIDASSTSRRNTTMTTATVITTHFYVWNKTESFATKTQTFKYNFNLKSYQYVQMLSYSHFRHIYYFHISTNKNIYFFLGKGLRFFLPLVSRVTMGTPNFFKVFGCIIEINFLVQPFFHSV